MRSPYLPLNPEQRERMEKFCQALESGEFKQAGNALKRGDGYCCLGVAAELYRREVQPKLKWEPANLGGLSCYSLDGFTGLPGFTVAEWYGWKYRGGGADSNPDLFIKEDEFDTVAASALNDTQHLPFPEIAAAFRRTFLTAETD
jgi:hypothetical protein